MDKQKTTLDFDRETAISMGYKYLNGDEENGIFIDLLSPCPVRPACESVDFQFAVDEQSCLTAAFRAVFHGPVQHVLHFLLYIHDITFIFVIVS